MAKKQIKEKSIEETLWDSANKLRGSVEPAEYKHVVLGLIFLKFASDKFEQHRKNLIAEGKEKYIEMADFYNMSNVFFLDEISRWSYIIKNSKQNDIALKIDTALHNIEKNNKALKGALPDNYFSRLGLDITKLSSLLDTINEIDTLKDKAQDIVGRVYEYFLSKFALAEGKGKGEFYTPKTIVNLIAEMIEPYKGIIYDPACGSGGMLMNLAIRGISANLGEKAADTFGDDQHKDLKADYIMANPPFNQKDWRGENQLIDDPRWRGYDVPPKSNANYGWILNMVSKLSDNGVAGFILANGALSGGGEEYKIRKTLIENKLVEAILVLPQDMFYTTNISVTIWILNKNKTAHTRSIGDETRKYRNRENEILFMDLRQIGEPFEKKFIQFNEQHVKDIATTYHTWQTATMVNEEVAPYINHSPLQIHHYKDIPEYCYSASFEEVAKKDFSLVPSKYIEFVNRDENIDFEEKMQSLQTEFADLLKAEAASKADLLTVFKELGYEIE